MEPPSAIGGVQCIALPVIPGGDGRATVAGPGTDELARSTGVDLLAALGVLQVDGRTGQVGRLPVRTRESADVLVLLVGVGDQTAADFRRAGAALARATTGRGQLATSVPAIADDAGFAAFVVGMTLGSFGFHWRQGPIGQPVGQVVLAGFPDADDRAGDLARAQAVSLAGWRARLLATVPSNLKSPEWLAEQARDMAASNGLAIQVWDEHELAERGFGGLVGVGQASSSPPRLIRLDYTPETQTRPAARVVLVGKGITFDTGGLSLKRAEGMRTMKRDMTGGGVVMATMAALAAVDCQVAVTGLVAAAENAVSGRALRPGDVLRQYGGRTTEVANTDAEGRLVLADVLAYAVAELAPTVIVDIATLTGAMKIALGQRTGGYFANHDGLAAQIESAGGVAGEPLWRMPLVADYSDKLSSTIADANNAPGGPGAIIAALFLQHFVAEVPWAHLDIASVGDSPSDHHEWTTGPTGFGARTLLAWLGQASPLAGIA
ncbi:MAG: leucyl aminopeptidase family protein [Nocardioides sp.]